nr:hypothetical protein [Granulosicoccus sp.]
AQRPVKGIPFVSYCKPSDSSHFPNKPIQIIRIKMSLRLDHFFILTTQGAPVADQMRSIGLKEAVPRDHKGQGTSNRRFNLANSTIEWLYVRDANEANNGSAGPLNFPHRLMSSEASCLGLVVRANPDASHPPFEGWDYQPDYFPNGWTFRVGSNSVNELEPLCICMPEQLPEPANETVDNPDWSLTQLQLTLPITELSSVLSQFAELPEVNMQTGGAHTVAIEMNQGRSGQSLILEHDPPIAIHW